MSSLERALAHIATQQTRLRADHEVTLSTVLEADRRRSYIVVSDPDLAKKLAKDRGRATTQLCILSAEAMQLDSALSAITSKGTAKGVALTPPSPRVTFTLHETGRKRKHPPAAPKAPLSK